MAVESVPLSSFDVSPRVGSTRACARLSRNDGASAAPSAIFPLTRCRGRSLNTAWPRPAARPAGANLQPWHFVAVSDPARKKEIRQAAEEEEREFYTHRAPAAWLEALAPIGTDWRKPFLEIAPWLIAIFSQPHRRLPDGTTMKHYYATESVGIATGILISALHQAGLASLTHTPSPMAFLNRILGRPAYEKPFLLLVVGYPARDARVPAITRKPLGEISSFLA